MRSRVGRNSKPDDTIRKASSRRASWSRSVGSRSDGRSRSASTSDGHLLPACASRLSEKRLWSVAEAPVLRDGGSIDPLREVQPACRPSASILSRPDGARRRGQGAVGAQRSALEVRAVRRPRRGVRGRCPAIAGGRSGRQRAAAGYRGGAVQPAVGAARPRNSSLGDDPPVGTPGRRGGGALRRNRQPRRRDPSAVPEHRRTPDEPPPVRRRTHPDRPSTSADPGRRGGRLLVGGDRQSGPAVPDPAAAHRSPLDTTA